MMNTGQIKPDMPVVCSQDGQFATVDHMEGPGTIKLKVDRPRDQAMAEWSTISPNYIDK